MRCGPLGAGALLACGPGCAAGRSESESAPATGAPLALPEAPLDLAGPLDLAEARPPDLDRPLLARATPGASSSASVRHTNRIRAPRRRPESQLTSEITANSMPVCQTLSGDLRRPGSPSV